ncbi:MAG: sugar translocase [Clostridium cadaveris]|uniref:Sugar translocase n=1 Tax=Clostridium cadaveris TaxID=1529 RepID=A0A316MD63_9CLOT|nr:MAG: sugar translocase [Clostridium cadaveris]
MRKKNCALNIITGVIEQSLNLILGFIIRTVFISVLGKEYLGLNGLFTQILTVLSLAELGFGTALNYSMYKPLVENDTEKLKVIMCYYKKIYHLIGIAILVIGLAIMPLLPYFIKMDANIDLNYNGIYLFYLINTVSSYLLFAYKGSILNASQKQYLIKKTACIIAILVSILQILFLYITKNYLVYLIMILFRNVMLNIIVARKADKMFPFLKEKCQEKISDKERNKIKKDVYSLSIYKVSDVMLSSTDSIMISSFIGISVTGIYSNYAYIITIINNFVGLLFSSVISSVGNLDAIASEKEKHNVFKNMFFLNIWVVGVCSLCLWQLLSDFINIWIGKEYLLDQVTVLIISINFLIKGLENTTYVFRIGGGVFQQSKFRPVASVVINIVSSIILAKYMGIGGVFLGTIISRLLTYFWIDPIVIYKNIFKKPAFEYFSMYLKGVLTIGVAGIILFKLNCFYKEITILIFILKAIITFIVPNIIFFLIYRKDNCFLYYKGLVKNIFKKKILNKNI